MIRKLVPTLAVGALLTLSACGGAAESSSDGTDGVKMGPGVTDKEINVGLLTDYSGPIAEAATSGSLGMEVKFDEVNAAGGVCGRKIVPVKADTKYDAQQTTQAYRANAKDMLMIGEVLGSVSINAIKPNVERDNMPALAISMNTATLEEKNIYVPLPTFEVELANGVVWAAEQAGATEEKPLKLGVITEGDEVGQPYQDAVVAAAEATPGVELVAKPTYAFGDQDFTAQVSELKAAGADVVMLGTAPAETAGVVGTSAQLGYSPQWIASSGSWFAGLAEPLKGLLNNFYVSGGYGTLADDVPGIAALKDALATYAPDAKPSNFQVGGWLFGEATVAALKQACENKDLTREGVIAALEDLKVDYQGITPEVDLGDGDSIVSYSSRMNTIGAQGELEAVGDFYASDAAKEWGAANGF
ncbi:ABC transporter substrate-binding protein [Nocardioides sp. MAH-18]|uniref:ABC transporter substrate-binding protein n=1 Tax=Nocardioides agri TaxID=2682843 RepID=A0A6L6XPB2_9ACTN|nr:MULTISPECIES: ABC transporter substrate-binding protein [unclassified Nocardioides]MBA2953807.1 ABC transporter substrate-binding protein [Nocardioides sp. CGMCC 1.13656]MVQ48672.1 ABC transporter substrate-binding protein [Nocardioides sp. MAH-18]